jgi:hypothetical protein
VLKKDKNYTISVWIEDDKDEPIHTYHLIPGKLIVKVLSILQNYVWQEWDN